MKLNSIKFGFIVIFSCLIPFTSSAGKLKLSQVESPHFTLFYRGDKKKAEEKISLLESFHTTQYSRFFNKELGDKITVILYKDKKEYTKVTGVKKEFFAHFESTDKKIYSNSQENIGAIFHECVHYWLNYNTGGDRVRLWFEEGFASFFESPEKKEDKSYEFGRPNWRQKSLQGKWTSLASFMQRVDLREEHDKAQARLFFLWLSKQGLLESYINKYIEFLDFDFSGIDALKEITGKNIEEINGEMKLYSEEISAI